MLPIQKKSMDKILQVYRNTFVSLIKGNSPEIFDNSSRLHAKVIIQELIRHAERTVRIQCTNFATDIYGDSETQAIIKDAICRGVEVKIVVRRLPQENLFADELNRLREGTVTKEKDLWRTDFCVVDSMRYRLERDGVVGSAYVCAYDTEVSELLENIFSRGMNPNNQAA